MKPGLIFSFLVKIKPGFFILAVSAVASAAQQRPPIIQPGAPGEAPKIITPEQATDLSKVRHTDADIMFMQSMIGHHAQALEMTALRPMRSTREEMRLLMLRIELSQADEIKFMESWLKTRGAEVPDAHAHHGDHAELMPGMLTPEEMDRLKAAKGPEFDRLFLEFMIKHHEGALVMVERLFSTPGAGQESEIFAFASDVVDDQRAEIERMAVLLKELQK
jgi:uncharacterized protein (DUF305 family)